MKMTKCGRCQQVSVIDGECHNDACSTRARVLAHRDAVETGAVLGRLLVTVGGLALQAGFIALVAFFVMRACL